MPTKRAKTLDDPQLTKLLKFIHVHSTMPIRDRLIVLLSFKAGLRVSEIVKIDLTAMLDTEGKIAKKNPKITIFSHVGKKERMREIPMHPDIVDALRTFMKAYPGAGFVAISGGPFRYANDHSRVREYRRMSVNGLTVVLRKMYAKAGFEGASSHSGRRTFGTRLARRANQYHQSLKDVQNLLGHARLDTTENYLDPSDDTVDLVNSL